jgi:hypothetical protein
MKKWHWNTFFPVNFFTFRLILIISSLLYTLLSQPTELCDILNDTGILSHHWQLGTSPQNQHFTGYDARKFSLKVHG